VFWSKFANLVKSGCVSRETRCYFQEGFSSWRIQRFNAAEKFPSLASRSFVGATTT
jgi:hypothetical protein